MPDENWRAQMRKGWLELAILAALWDDRHYGLDIIRRLADGSDLVVTEGTIYPVLARLKQDGLVRAEWQEGESGHPRKYYALTAAGRRRAIAMGRESREFMRQIEGLLEPVLKGDPS